MAGISGSDDSFIAFAFAIVSMVMIFLYFPVFIGMIKDVYEYATRNSEGARRRRRQEEDEGEKIKSWRVLFNDFAELPRVVVTALLNPKVVLVGANVLWAHKGLARSVFLGDAIRFCFRPRFLTLWLWCVLLSSAMYASMTFDPYAVMGLPTSATTSEVKRVYRQLSKINHPDHNKTEAAKVIYGQVRKAYKALVDRDAFDKDMETEEMSVGIGLPSFLTSHEHDGKVLIILLGVLIGVPILIWYKFSGGPMDKLRLILARVHETEQLLEPLYIQLGIPVDPKFVEHRRERRELAEILVNMGLVPYANERVVDGFPPLVDFKRMCLQPERNVAVLAKYGFDVNTHATLKNYFEHYEIGERLKLPEGTFVRADTLTYEAIVYVIRKAQLKVERDVAEISSLLCIVSGAPGVDLRTPKKLKAHHDELLETLAIVYRDAKPIPRDIRTLIEVPAKREEIVRDIPKEMEMFLAQLNRHAQQQQQMMMQQMQRQRR